MQASSLLPAASGGAHRAERLHTSVTHCGAAPGSGMGGCRQALPNLRRPGRPLSGCTALPAPVRVGGWVGGVVGESSTLAPKPLQPSAPQPQQPPPLLRAAYLQVPRVSNEPNIHRLEPYGFDHCRCISLALRRPSIHQRQALPCDQAAIGAGHVLHPDVVKGFVDTALCGEEVEVEVGVVSRKEDCGRRLVGSSPFICSHCLLPVLVRLLTGTTIN